MLDKQAGSYQLTLPLSQVIAMLAFSNLTLCGREPFLSDAVTPLPQ